MLSLQDEREHRRFIEGVAHIHAGALVEKEPDHLFVPVHGCQIEGSLAVGSLRFDGRAVLQSGLDGSQIPGARSGEQVFVAVGGKQADRG